MSPEKARHSTKQLVKMRKDGKNMASIHTSENDKGARRLGSKLGTEGRLRKPEWLASEVTQAGP